MSQTKTRKPMSQKELARLGEQLVSLFETGYLSRKEALKFSFLKGVIGGFGAFLGGTLLVTLVVGLLNLLLGLSWMDRAIDLLRSGLK